MTWDVTGTDANSINASEMDIVLSTDSSETFNEILAQNVPNNGTYDITLPNIPSIGRRVMVKEVIIFSMLLIRRHLLSTIWLKPIAKPIVQLKI